jgi:hypothetical protein
MHDGNSAQPMHTHERSEQRRSVIVSYKHFDNARAAVDRASVCSVRGKLLLMFSQQLVSIVCLPSVQVVLWHTGEQMLHKLVCYVDTAHDSTALCHNYFILSTDVAEQPCCINCNTSVLQQLFAWPVTVMRSSVVCAVMHAAVSSVPQYHFLCSALRRHTSSCTSTCACSVLCAAS